MQTLPHFLDQFRLLGGEVVLLTDIVLQVE